LLAPPRQIQKQFITDGRKQTVKIKVKQIVLLTQVLLTLISQSGCCTYKMWDEGAFDSSNMPAANPNLKLFEAKQRNDFLAVYNEYSERKEATRTRAYWLNENQDRVRRAKAPEFVAVRSAQNLAPVPVYYSSNNVVQSQFYAIVDTNHQSFALYSSNSVVDLYNLPFYDDGRGKPERLAMTPLTLTADVVIAAGIVAVVVGCIWLEGEASDSNRQY
jgi:hypothetical protein